MYNFYSKKIKLEYVDMICKITKTSKIGFYILNNMKNF